MFILFNQIHGIVFTMIRFIMILNHFDKCILKTWFLFKYHQIKNQMQIVNMHYIECRNLVCFLHGSFMYDWQIWIALSLIFYAKISAGQRLIMINRIQNKSVCVHNIYVCTVYIYYVYINTHACIYWRKMCYVYILNIFIYNINYMNINIYCTCKYMCLYINIINIHSTCYIIK